MALPTIARIYFDNTFVSTVEKVTEKPFDFERFVNYFQEEFETVTFDFFYQKTEQETWGERNKRVKEIEGYGITCHLPMRTSLHRASYAPALESSALMGEAVLQANRDFVDHGEGAVATIFAVTHMSYIPFLKSLEDTFGVFIDLVFDMELGNDRLGEIAHHIYPTEYICY